MKKLVLNFAIIRPIRTLRDLPEKRRRNLIRQMHNYLHNCEYEEKRLRMFRDKINA